MCECLKVMRPVTVKVCEVAAYELHTEAVIDSFSFYLVFSGSGLKGVVHAEMQVLPSDAHIRVVSNP